MKFLFGGRYLLPLFLCLVVRAGNYLSGIWLASIPVHFIVFLYYCR